MRKLLLAFSLPLVMFSCGNLPQEADKGVDLCSKIDETVEVAQQQMGYQVKLIEGQEEINVEQTGR